MIEFPGHCIVCDQIVLCDLKEDVIPFIAERVALDPARVGIDEHDPVLALKGISGDTGIPGIDENDPGMAVQEAASRYGGVVACHEHSSAEQGEYWRIITAILDLRVSDLELPGSVNEDEVGDIRTALYDRSVVGPFIVIPVEDEESGIVVCNEHILTAHYRLEDNGGVDKREVRVRSDVDVAVHVHCLVNEDHISRDVPVPAVCGCR